jgi:hypothetical protein
MLNTRSEEMNYHDHGPYILEMIKRALGGAELAARCGFREECLTFMELAKKSTLYLKQIIDVGTQEEFESHVSKIDDELETYWSRANKARWNMRKLTLYPSY